MLEELIERLEKSAGPDREIDRAIHSHIFPEDAGEAPEYTKDLAAAICLIEGGGKKAIPVCIAALKARLA